MFFPGTNLNEGSKINPMDALLESTRYPSINESEKGTLKLLMINAQAEQNTIMNEAVVSQDVAQFTPILMPLIRYLYPRLIANELLGVQPLATPTAYIYSLVSQYRAKPKDERVKLVLYKLNTPATENKDEDIAGETIIHKEGNFVVVTMKNGRIAAGNTFGAYTVEAAYSNVASYPKVLKNFSVANLTDEQRPDINYVGFEVAKKAVEAKPRALHGEYSLEMYQDLKSQHGLLADDEMMRLMASEIQTDIDADVVNFVNTNATQLPDWDAQNIKATGLNRTIDIARELAFHIAHEASAIAKRTNRGQANVLLCSSKVANLLASLENFALGHIGNEMSKVGVLTGFVGTLDGRLRVVVDPYANEEYATVLYKGEDKRDAMGYFCPYVPLTFTKVINSQTGMNGIIAKTRYALTTIPGFEDPASNDRAALYASTFTVVGI